METNSLYQENVGVKIRKPRHYTVIMLNDDFTTMEFVVRVLTDIFGKDRVSAEALMLAVHRSGRAAVGSYPYDIAMTKVSRALAMAKEEGFPFRMRVEETG